MQFGLFIPQGWRLDLAGVPPERHWEAMLSVANYADVSVGFDSVWVYDHFHTVPVPTDEATHEAWTLMAALGAATGRVRLGQMCTCVGYRNPAYLAKVAATVDVVSGGRVEMGIGAGWYEHEWRAYGYGFPRAGQRLDMLDEGIQIMRQLWTTGTASLAGSHYQVHGAICRPLPLQPGGLPLWVAGGGEQRTLRIAATYARPIGSTEPGCYTRYTNFGGLLDVFKRKSQILAEHCRDLGTEFDSITRSANYNVVIGETQRAAEDRLAGLADLHRRYVKPEDVDRSLKDFRRSPAFGTPEQIVERFTALRDAGMTYAICYFPGAADDRSGIELFEREVIPALR